MLKTVELGGFQVLAHLDFPRLFFDSWEIDPGLLDKILSKVVQQNIVLEVNTSSIHNSHDEPMPSYSIIERYRQLGGKKIVLGSDAHCTKDLFAECNGVVRHIDYRKKRAKIELQLFNANCFCWVACDVICSSTRK